jgi:hypothetical protein
MKEQEITKMEFLLTLNENIIVQRFFNVKGYNPKAKNSLEVYELIKYIKDELQYFLKMKTVTYMLENQELITYDKTVMDTSFTEDPEYFNIFIKIGDEIISQRIFDGKLFPPKVRYTVDVRPFLKEILRELTEVFSTKKLTYKYLDLEMSK